MRKTPAKPSALAETQHSAYECAQPVKELCSRLWQQPGLLDFFSLRIPGFMQHSSIIADGTLQISDSSLLAMRESLEFLVENRTMFYFCRRLFDNPKQNVASRVVYLYLVKRRQSAA